MLQLEATGTGEVAPETAVAPLGDDRLIAVTMRDAQCGTGISAGLVGVVRRLAGGVLGDAHIAHPLGGAVTCRVFAVLVARKLPPPNASSSNVSGEFAAPSALEGPEQSASLDALTSSWDDYGPTADATPPGLQFRPSYQAVSDVLELGSTCVAPDLLVDVAGPDAHKDRPLPTGALSEPHLPGCAYASAVGICRRNGTFGTLFTLPTRATVVAGWAYTDSDGEGGDSQLAAMPVGHSFACAYSTLFHPYLYVTQPVLERQTINCDVDAASGYRPGWCDTDILTAVAGDTGRRFDLADFEVVPN